MTFYVWVFYVADFNYYRVPPDLRDLNYGKYNTTRLDVDGMKALLMKLRFMQVIARGEQAVAEE